jgi:hypothetical protein
MFSAQLKEAAARALGMAVILGGSAFFGVLQGGGSLRAAEIAAGVAFFGALALRMGVEGLYDQRRATTGDVKPSDVGAEYVGR